MSTTDSMTKDWLTVAQIAKALQVTSMTVYRLCEAGTLESVRFGRSVRIDRKVLESYILAHTTGARVPLG
jgi:excisionase family DNA binding protein